MLDTLSQPITLLWFLLFGIFFGCCIGCVKNIRKLAKHIVWKWITDFLLSIACSALLIYSLTLFNYGEIRLYLLISFVLGVVLERYTLGILFAKLFDYMYNRLSKIHNKVLTTKLGRVIFK